MRCLGAGVSADVGFPQLDCAKLDTGVNCQRGKHRPRNAGCFVAPPTCPLTLCCLGGQMGEQENAEQPS